MTWLTAIVAEPTFADLIRKDFAEALRAMREVWKQRKWYEQPVGSIDADTERKTQC